MGDCFMLDSWYNPKFSTQFLCIVARKLTFVYNAIKRLVVANPQLVPAFFRILKSFQLVHNFKSFAPRLKLSADKSRLFATIGKFKCNSQTAATAPPKKCLARIQLEACNLGFFLPSRC